MKTIISTAKAPAAIGPYSQATDLGSLVITSGQLPIDPATGAFFSLRVTSASSAAYSYTSWGWRSRIDR